MCKSQDVYSEYSIGLLNKKIMGKVDTQDIAEIKTGKRVSFLGAGK